MTHDQAVLAVKHEMAFRAQPEESTLSILLTAEGMVLAMVALSLFVIALSLV